MSAHDKTNYEKELTFAKALALRAGAMTLDGFGVATKAVWKSDNTPLTVTDTAINQAVIEQVQAAFPADGLLGEEDSFETGRSRLWVVDPIDGTQPFNLGAPLSTFCLSLVIDGQPVLGIIYDPYLKRLYHAVQGNGAFLNDVSIHVSSADKFEHNYVILSSNMHGNTKTAGMIVDEIAVQNAKALNFRSFAYGSTFVANGQAIAAIIGGGHPWDASATKIIVEEAGGKATDIFGNDRRYDGEGQGLVVTNGIMHEQLLELIAN
jgi:histidinol-phosphatase